MNYHFNSASYFLSYFRRSDIYTFEDEKRNILQPKDADPYQLVGHAKNKFLNKKKQIKFIQEKIYNSFKKPIQMLILIF
jgi:hypothetical protein